MRVWEKVEISIERVVACVNTPKDFRHFFSILGHEGDNADERYKIRMIYANWSHIGIMGL